MQKFHKSNLSSANKELEDLLLVAQFTVTERNKFLRKIQKVLARDKVTLDFIDNLI